LAVPPRAHSLISSAYPPRSGLATRTCLFQIHRACLTPGIGFVSHACPQQGPRWQPWRPMSHPVGAGQIGFVWCAGFHRGHRQPCRPLPTAVRAGIGFVWPRPVACPICHNAFAAKYLRFLSLRRELGLFRTFWPQRSQHGRPCRSSPIPARAGDWLCFARLPQRRQCSDPAGQRLFQAVRGKLGSFGAAGSSRNSAGTCAGPSPSPFVSANWVRLYR
jgi:hypothetical protein